MSAMVRTRSMGRRWALRACGRALFADVAARYKAGVVDFDYQGQHPTVLVTCCNVGFHVAETGPRQFKTCARVKALDSHMFSPHHPGAFLDRGCFFYLSMLANSRGFSRMAGVLELVWERAVHQSLRKSHGSRNFGWSFQEFLDSDIKPDFGFHPMKGFAIMPGIPSTNAIEELGANLWFDLRAGLMIAAKDLLGPELLCTLFFATFLSKVFPPPSSFLAVNYFARFGNVLDLRLQ